LVKQNQPLLHARVKALPWPQVPAGSITREAGHGRTETRTVKAAHVSGLDFPHARQAIKITRWRKDTAAGKVSRETAYAVTSLASAHATAQDLARLVREHWSIELNSRTACARRLSWVKKIAYRPDAVLSRTRARPSTLAGSHRLHRVVDDQETERAAGQGRAGQEDAQGQRVDLSPAHDAKRGAGVPSTLTSSSTRRWVAEPASRIAPRSTLLSWRSIPQMARACSASGARRS
jgi:hypothetical protein